MAKKEPNLEEYDFSDPLSTDISVEYTTDQPKSKKKAAKKSAAAKAAPKTKPKPEPKKEDLKNPTQEPKEMPEEPKVEDKPPIEPVQSQKSSRWPMFLTVIVIVAAVYLVLNFNTIFGDSQNENISGLVTGHASAIVATVNGVDITQDFIDSQYRSLSPYNQRLVTKEMILNKTINEELLLQEAKKQGVSVTGREVKDHIQELLDSSDIKPSDFERQLKEVNLTEEDIQKIYHRQLTITKLLEQTILNEIDIIDSEIEQYYNTNKQLFTAGDGEISASHILLETKEDAEKVLDELKNGMDFAEAAKKYSVGPSAPNGGSLGFFSKGVMVQPFEDAVFALDVGEISDVIETQFGFHIIKRDSNIILLSVAKENIEKQLQREKESAALEIYMSSLRKTAKIAVLINNHNEPVLAAPNLEESDSAPELEEPGDETIDKTEEKTESEEVVEPDTSEQSAESEEVVEAVEPQPVEPEEVVEAVEPEQVFQFNEECTRNFGVNKETIIVYYSDWCSSCQVSLDQAADLLDDVYFAELDTDTASVVDKCFSDKVTSGFPQYICVSSGEVKHGRLTDTELKQFAASCS